MNCFTQEQLNRITSLVREIEKLSDIEKLFLYLQLPCGRAEPPEGKSKLNFRSTELFSKKPDQETTQTYTWILSHLEEDANVSLPKQEVYDEYRAFCQANRFEPLCVADFGKAMKHAFPCIKPRRLGQRGNSRYCYSGLRKKYKFQPPNLPDIIEPTFCLDNDCSQAYNQIIADCQNNPNECVLNERPSFNDYKVMNLKIDTSAQHTIGYHCNLNGDEYNFGSSHKHTNHVSAGQLLMNPKLMAPSTMMSLHQPMHIEAFPRQHQPPLHSQGPPSVDNTNNHSHTSATTTQCPTHQSNSVGQNSRFACSSSDMCQYRSGTPDDDDYKHNYLTSTPIDRQFGMGALQLHQPILNGAGNSRFAYNHHTLNDDRKVSTVVVAANSSPLDTSNINATSSNNCDNIRSESAIRNCEAPSFAPNGDTSDPTTSTQHNTHSSNNNNNNNTRGSNATSTTNSTNSQSTSPSGTRSNIVSNQASPSSSMGYRFLNYSNSPFQSPASTPYPSMSNYVAQEAQDYYPTECIRYPEQ